MIHIKNIYKTFYVPHEVKALVDVSNKVEKGEVVVVIGKKYISQVFKPA